MVSFEFDYSFDWLYNLIIKLNGKVIGTISKNENVDDQYSLRIFKPSFPSEIGRTEYTLQSFDTIWECKDALFAMPFGDLVLVGNYSD
jgi:hypothetical protein